MDKNDGKLTPRYLIYDIVRFQVKMAIVSLIAHRQVYIERKITRLTYEWWKIKKLKIRFITEYILCILHLVRNSELYCSVSFQ